ncbi:WxL domain-containing protein [Enterococcus faecalis]|uniref:WxL domain-containing protein n=1 Tax=Enterococcus faecalis TaxID=1351 RepID=UPI0018CDB545|nr:WxL domain-containing protein [Enterococcus faecalis]EGO5016480.1 WxL domain-containing protein [Enterococcus faecalis]EGO6561351.1 WxL domain-containing protein [Enterococcus faecalis]EGO7560952.1 WxL domain-containing protein [Enterococcus faecalis]EGO7742724.1 WxL domain-containing protein [Enterococcus faecalis]EIP7780864.1 WxL domain-containing protein [Enterococcus faecalis]
MKKSNLLVSSLVLCASTLLVAAPVFADTTDGTVELIQGGGTNGPLTLEQAPSFDFGSQQISTSLETYQADGTLPLSISDLRGTGAGWNVTAKITDFTDGSNILKGANFTLPDVVPTSQGNGAAPDNGVQTTLNNADQMILNAQDKTGLGQWDAQYNQAELAVPSGNYAGSYSATIEWTLIDQPTTAS